ncbi:MAG: GTP cyclohydrolase II [Alphaproteobacteria bacterium]|nr:GTP cyclohydrolase II [Alphaproteobacteria bacterium]
MVAATGWSRRSSTEAGSVAGDPRIVAVNRAMAELRRGAPVVIVADGAALLALAAEAADATTLARLAALSRTPLALLITPERVAHLQGRPMPPEVGPAAISLPLADDAAPEDIKALADPTADLDGATPALPADATPAPGPVPTATIALAKLSRLLPAAVVTPAALGAAEDGYEFARRLDLIAVAATSVLNYPDAVAGTLTRVTDARVPLEGSEDVRFVAFRPLDGGLEHLAIVVGDPLASGEPPLVRLHSECFTGDLLGSLRCDCGDQLRGAIQRMAKEGAGVLLYLAQEGRGIGLMNKLRAYRLQDAGADTLDANRQLGFGADERGFQVAAAMLRDLGIGKVRLMTNNPDKVRSLGQHGVEVVERVPHKFEANGHNARYLATKAERFGHMLG